MSPIVRASNLQRQAASPDSCVWVAASAGTGKTKVLTDRVLNLLLSGAKPEKILCLTFTKAAAGEMLTRLQKRLCDWATVDQQDLATNLTDILGYDPSHTQIQTARTLFTQILDTPGGLKIQTIHSFCQTILKRFPLEAGISPHFKVIDDHMTLKLLDKAYQETLNDHSLQDNLEEIAQRYGEDRLKEMLMEGINQRQSLEWFKKDQESLYQELSNFFSTNLKLTPQILTAKAIEGIPENIKDAARILLVGALSDAEKAKSILRWLSKPTIENFHLYVSAFLTKEGAIRKTLATLKVTKPNPELLPFMESEAQRLFQIQEQLSTLTVARTSLHLSTYISAIIRHFESLKKSQALLDYDDLIAKTSNLLSRPDIAPWVLYKLDGGLDHILVDEAQDTSAAQWQVIEAIANEFFAGHAANDTNRSLFVVGDSKQSIYSFQGADPRVFEKMRKHFAAAAANAQKKWTQVDLDVSFRSTEPILNSVDAVFAAAKDGLLIQDSPLKHASSRIGHSGLVEIWPAIDPSEIENSDWKLPIVGTGAIPAPHWQLAQSIADQIKQWLDNGELLKSQARPIQPQDILILVQRRGSFVDLMIKALKRRNIPIAGCDRMLLSEHVSVQDLMSLGRFTLLPQDDLSLAEILRSPLIGISEEALFIIAYDRQDKTLWESLQEQSQDNLELKRATTYLNRILQHKNEAPFDFYSYVLDTLGGRRSFVSRLGLESLEPIEEFLNLTLSYEQANTPSLQSFIHWLENGDTEIKRDLDLNQRNEVRVMTVHGSKGLQAPIIFLPDTIRAPQLQNPILWHHLGKDKMLPVWNAPQAIVCTQVDELKQNAQKLIDEEYQRLLYVALTRAEDRLYICGWQAKRKAKEHNWHSTIEQALLPLATEVQTPTGPGFRIESEQQTIPKPKTLESTKRDFETSLPDWVNSPVESLSIAPKQLTKKTDSEEIRRGILIHRLLEVLPNVRPEMRFEQGMKLLQGNDPEILTQVLHIISKDEFKHLFGAESRSEVPIFAKIDGENISGRIDRLVIRESEILIIDYKTDKSPATDPGKIPPAYIKQLLTYKHVLQRIYPHIVPQCYILWTETAKLMSIQYNSTNSLSAIKNQAQF